MTATVADVMPDGMRWTGLTALVEKAFGHPVKCDWPEPPTVRERATDFATFIG
jgi:hypothetical protein